MNNSVKMKQPFLILVLVAGLFPVQSAQASCCDIFCNNNVCWDWAFALESCCAEFPEHYFVERYCCYETAGVEHQKFYVEITRCDGSQYTLFFHAQKPSAFACDPDLYTFSCGYLNYWLGAPPSCAQTYTAGCPSPANCP